MLRLITIMITFFAASLYAESIKKGEPKTESMFSDVYEKGDDFSTTQEKIKNEAKKPSYEESIEKELQAIREAEAKIEENNKKKLEIERKAEQSERQNAHIDNKKNQKSVETEITEDDSFPEIKDEDVNWKGLY